MKSQSYSLIRYDADEGNVFDYAIERFTDNEDGTKTQEHLYVNTIFIGGNDDINNYIEVKAPVVENI